MLQIGSKLALLLEVFLCFSVVLVLAQYKREKLDLSIAWRKGRSHLHESFDGYFGLQLSKKPEFNSIPTFFFLLFLHNIPFVPSSLRAQPDVPQMHTITEKQWAMVTEQPTF